MSEWKETSVGIIPIDWNVRTIDKIKANKKRSVAMGPFGSNITKDNFVESGVPVIRGNNLVEYIFYDNDFVYVTEEKANQLSGSQCVRGDIVITHRGTLGQVGYIPESSKYERYIVSQSGMKLTVDDSIIDKRFIFLFLKSRVGQYLLLRNASQTGVPAIAQPTTSLKAIPVPIPPSEEAKTIVEIIFTIQRKIDLLRRQNTTLEAIAQTLFKHWFVDFEFPFDFAQGRPDEQGRPYKSAGGPMQASELGEIPVGWRVGKLGKEFDILMGQSPPGESYNEEGNGMVFFQGRTDFGFRFPTIRLYTTEPKRIANRFDVLVSVRAPVGDVNVAYEKCCVGRGLAAVKSRFKSFCFYKIKSYRRQFDIFESEGTVFGALSKSDFNNLPSIVPPTQLVSEFDRVVNPIDRKMYNNERQMHTLTRLRDTLLPKLMSGELRVDAERVV